MKNGIISGFRQAVGIWMIVVPLIIAVLIVMNFVDPLVRTYWENSYIVDGFHIELLLQGVHSDAVSSFLPILATLPFAGSFVDDLKSKYVRYLLVRSSFRTYLISRIVVGFFVGGLTILCGALIAWGTTAAILIPLEQETAKMVPVGTSGLIEIYFLMFMTGGFWSVVGMAMSTLMESKYIAYASPFVIYYLLVILYERYFSDSFVIYPRSWTEPTAWPFGCWGAAIFLLVLTLIFAILFVFRAGRRLQQL